MTPTETKTWMVGLFGSLIVVAGTYFAVVGPQLSARAEAATAVETTRTAAALAASTADDLQAKAAKIDAAIIDVNRLTSQFPTEYAQGEWISMMYAAARNAQVQIQLLAPTVPADPSRVDGRGIPLPVPPPVAPIPGQPTTPAPGTSAPAAPLTTSGTATTGAPVEQFAVAASAVHLEAAGPAANIVKFLDELETLDRPMLISNLELNGEDGDMRLKLDGTTFLTRPLEVPEQFRQ